MKILLKKYKSALKAGKFPIANQIEGIILKYANSFEFERRDMIIEQLTLASI
jgi:hypothetical protein